MGGTVTATARLSVGTAPFVDSVSPSGRYGVVFEDDGETGYFYGLDLEGAGDQKILDALHIYNVNNVKDRNKPSLPEVVWTPDGGQAALLINRYPHRVFDFLARRACCRTGFPLPNKDFTGSHQWDDSVWKPFTEPGQPGALPWVGSTSPWRTPPWAWDLSGACFIVSPALCDVRFKAALSSRQVGPPGQP